MTGEIPLGFGMRKAIALRPVLIDADTESRIALWEKDHRP